MLVILTSTAIALAAAGAALLFIDLRDSHSAWSEDLRTEAAILSLAVQPALSFDDREAAQRNLSALQARASIQAAALYDSAGQQFAQYARTGQLMAPQNMPAPVEPTSRISLNLAALLQTRRLFLFITGAHKRDLLLAAARRAEPTLPVAELLSQRVPMPEVYWAP